jgi:poly(hydroxyalkanoate) depolymerase family esterase
MIARLTLVLVMAGGMPSAAGAAWIHGSAANGYGTREFNLYVPAGYVAGNEVPLVVALHGCTQTAEEFAGLARFSEFADRRGVLVLMPIQNPFVNPTRCWNWPLTVNQRRDQGEPSLIKQMIDWTVAHYSVNRRRIYVAGVSSGGFMTSVMLSCYADVFAAGMVASGGMYAATTDPFYGSYVGPYGSNRDPNVAGREAWQCSGSLSPRIVPVLVFQGSVDAIVIPRNAEQTIEQFAQMNDLGDDGTDNNSIVNAPVRTSSSRAAGGLPYTWSDFDAGGRTIMQLYVVEGMGHAWSGGDPAFAYAEPSGPDETAIMWSFFAQHTLGPDRRRAARK